MGFPRHRKSCRHTRRKESGGEGGRKNCIFPFSETNLPAKTPLSLTSQPGRAVVRRKIDLIVALNAVSALTVLN